jgi:hypothetical protein
MSLKTYFINIFHKEEIEMRNLEIYDPAMCCSTGVCGPSIDPELIRVSTVINILKSKGIEVKRYNLSQQPQAFIVNNKINYLLQKGGSDVLPITLLEGEVVKTNSYPTNSEFAQWLGIREAELPTHTYKRPNPNKGCGCGKTGCC